MPAKLSEAVVAASNQARDAFLRRIDPAAFPAKQPAPAAGGGDAPPPPMLAPPVKKLLSPGYYGNGFFQNISEFLSKQEKVLATHSTTENLDYAGWFNYFFTEVRRSKPSPEALGRIFSVLFSLSTALERAGQKLVLKGDFRFPAALPPDFHRTLLIEPAGIPLDVLTFLLDEGFETFPAVSAKAGRIDTGEGTADDPKVEHSFGALFALQSATSNKQPIERDTTKEYLIFYRGDSRPPNLVIQHGGARCRADLAAWRKAAHMDEAWHPWKDAALSKKMWIRKGNADNDYFTVNSIGMDFHVSCAYPMLRLSEIDRSLTGRIVDWTDVQLARLRSSGKADFCSILNHRTGNKEVALYDTSRVYMCVFKDDTLLSPTYTRNTYPEMGVRTVDLTQIIAWIVIDRYHDNAQLLPGSCYESTADGSTMTIKVRDWGWMNGANGAKNTLGIEDTSVFENRMNGYKGKVFEIIHSRLLSETKTTYDPVTRTAKDIKWSKVAAPTLKK